MLSSVGEERAVALALSQCSQILPALLVYTLKRAAGAREKVKYKNDTKLAKVRSDMKDWGLVTGRATQSALVINMVMQSDYSITLAQAKVSATGITVIEGVDA